MLIAYVAPMFCNVAILPVCPWTSLVVVVVAVNINTIVGTVESRSNLRVNVVVEDEDLVIKYLSTLRYHWFGMCCLSKCLDW